LYVEDTGIGIPEEAKNKLFKPLFTTKARGQGFGLAVVKRLTEALNGKITFESEAGKGTRFIIEFPLPENQLIANVAAFYNGNGAPLIPITSRMTQRNK